MAKQAPSPQEQARRAELLSEGVQAVSFNLVAPSSSWCCVFSKRTSSAMTMQEAGGGSVSLGRHGSGNSGSSGSNSDIDIFCF